MITKSNQKLFTLDFCVVSFSFLFFFKKNSTIVTIANIFDAHTTVLTER